MDNWGHASTGQIKKTVELVLNSPLKLADKISLTRVISKGSGSTETKFELPIGYSGGRVTISALNLHYNLVDEFADLETAGASNERSAVFFSPLFLFQQRGSERGLLLSNFQILIQLHLEIQFLTKTLEL